MTSNDQEVFPIFWMLIGQYGHQSVTLNRQYSGELSRLRRQQWPWWRRAVPWRWHGTWCVCHQSPRPSCCMWLCESRSHPTRPWPMTSCTPQHRTVTNSRTFTHSRMALTFLVPVYPGCPPPPLNRLDHSHDVCLEIKRDLYVLCYVQVEFTHWQLTALLPFFLGWFDWIAVLHPTPHKPKSFQRRSSPPISRLVMMK